MLVHFPEEWNVQSTLLSLPKHGNMYLNWIGIRMYEVNIIDLIILFLLHLHHRYAVRIVAVLYVGFKMTAQVV